MEEISKFISAQEPTVIMGLVLFALMVGWIQAWSSVK